MAVVRANRNGYSRNELERKTYSIQLRMQDNPSSGQASQEAVRTLTLVIESTNENRMVEDPQSRKGVVVYTYVNSQENVPCGSTYVEDPDDWDLPDKNFECISGCRGDYQYFTVDFDTGAIFMIAGAPPGEHELRIRVNDTRYTQSVVALTTVRVVYIDDEALGRAGSVRLTGACLCHCFFSQHLSLLTPSLYFTCTEY